CDRSQSNASNLKAHIINHDKDKAFNCGQPNCKYKTNRKADLNRHSQTHRPREEIKRWKCNGCDLNFSRQDSVPRH
ncbi:hypothetical protein BCR41DRAFT_287708, partial [Lobosporangium transversale]